MAEVKISNHCIYRFMERGIDVHEAKKIAKNGVVTKSESNGTLTKQGICGNGRTLEVVVIVGTRDIIIKTAYYADKPR